MQENAYFCSQIVIKSMFRRTFTAYIPYIFALLFTACADKTDKPVVTPWGEIKDSIPTDEDFDLSQIQANGELIVLTVNGPSTCYDYKGKKLGREYLLCQKFAETTGVGLRVELCRDTSEVLRRLQAGEGDIAALQLTVGHIGTSASDSSTLTLCGARTDSLNTGWAVSKEKPMLIAALNDWFVPELIDDVIREEQYLLSTQSIRRKVFAPMLNRQKGIISPYDHLFMTYAMSIRWDWRLLAAQCYQESTFDPQARSWAGALGLMQIMPSTAELLGLPISRIHDPESNISAATRYLSMLEAKLMDIPHRGERLKFVLACYNGGYHHIRDAMTLAGHEGKDTRRWADVSRYVLRLSDPKYYNSPLVKYGYMRGNETVEYVERIQQRWHSYKGMKTVRAGYNSMLTPQKATKKRKYNIDR